MLNVICLICGILNYVTFAQPILGNAKAVVPVAISDEYFSFEVDVSWQPSGYNSSQYVYWQICRDDNHVVKSGRLSVSTNGALIDNFEETIRDSKIGKNRYIIGSKLNIINLPSINNCQNTDMSLDPHFLKETSSRTSFFVKVLRGPVTLIPPIITILIAVTTKNVMLSLFCGVFSASVLIWNYNIFYAFINSFSDIIVDSVASRDHAFIILFTWILGGMVSCIMKSGGGEGLVNSLRSYATSPRAGALVTFFLGLIIFFDDYANTLIVGQTVLPITDSLGISREKLAFLVDATVSATYAPSQYITTHTHSSSFFFPLSCMQSAPVSSISPVSSWIGFELSLIDEVLAELTASGEDISCYESSAFLIFLETIPSR
jgi:hypothetical protein